MRIYIAGPMTGLPDLNFPAFHAEAANLRAAGHEVVNPAEINPDHSMSWCECMRRDIAQLVTCDAIRLLPGWEKSKGATLEHHIAESLELLVIAEVEGGGEPGLIFEFPKHLEHPAGRTMLTAAYLLEYWSRKGAILRYDGVIDGLRSGADEIFKAAKPVRSNLPEMKVA